MVCPSYRSLFLAVTLGSLSVASWGFVVRPTPSATSVALSWLHQPLCQQLGGPRGKASSFATVALSDQSDPEVKEIDGAFAAAAGEPTTEATSANDPSELSEAEQKKVTRERYTAFIGNLPFDVDDDAVRDLFEPFGKVVLVNIPKDRERGQPRGFAFVDMNAREELEAAMSSLDGTSFGGRTIRVTRSVPKDELEKQPKPPREPRAPEDASIQKIYVGNIPFDTTKDELMAFYQPHGEVKEVYVPVDSNTGGGRGFAFVTMAAADAERAIAATNGQDFGGRTLSVSMPLPPGAKAPPRAGERKKLYVGNLSFYTVEETLAALFEEFGTVHDCFIPRDSETGATRGFAFVTMDGAEAKRAVSELDGCEVDGRSIRVNEAQPKKESRSYGRSD